MEHFLHYLTLGYLLQGILYTLQITLYGLVGGTLIGILLAAMQLSRFTLLAGFSRGYAVIFRGTPLILQLVFVYDALPYAGLKLSAVAAGAVALSLNEAPFISEIIRAAILSVNRGQIMAGQALGMAPSVITHKIIIPQAIRTMLPAFGGEAVSALKNSSLASFISVQELTLRSTQLASSTFDFFSIFFASGVMYLALTGIIAALQLLLERVLDFEVKNVRTTGKIDAILNTLPKTRLKSLSDADIVAGDASGDVLIDIRGLHKSYGDNKVLNGLDLHIRKGQIVALLGPSGSGKSTLLRCINGLDQYDAGEIAIGGDVIGRASSGEALLEKALARQRVKNKIGMVFQNFNLFQHINAIENVAMPLMWIYGESRGTAYQHAYGLLKRVGLENRYAALPGQMSGGQQQRVAIARTLATRPRILLLDEPTSALDPELVGEVLEIIRGLAQVEGLTMVISTHQIRFAEQVADYCVFLDGGVVVEEGDARQVINQPRHPRTQRFLSLMAQTQ
ncbi:amino acid ABC transporter permease/ATP-binding protein [Martelella alba]|uniref:Amino acid ABC transporter permease/ATP-binding protein n=1 Tax=Martelella alba TaxID=2590451 RepID=A0ABY2SP65_9HYPH|nr:amino acid ABC transporter permease/ATP-binding protein [Martelella alba]TKI07749.1 amino acid ABC transporter permease/ATP-binding protein [Martelella alba]